ncbi:MAG: OmpA family protein [Flavobacteriales bacterium]|nr:OmpA family protein [Flavobacteriales bacterium]
MTRIESEDTELEVAMFLIDEKGSIKSRSTRIGDQLYGFGVDKGLAEFIKLLAPKDYSLQVASGKKGIIGRVVDKQTFLFGRSGVEVGLYNKERQLMSSSVTDKNGIFSFVIQESDDWDIKVTSDQEKDFTEIVIVDEFNVPSTVANSDDMGADGFFKFNSLPQEMVEMKRMEVKDTRMQLPSDFGDMSIGKSIVLKNILFAYGSADLLESSFEELNRLSTQLQKMTSVKIAVFGHTDNQGSSTMNQILSENRAKAVVDYLINKGIDANRMTFKGLGESDPIASNDTEEGRKKNRRVEFKVVD